LCIADGVIVAAIDVHRLNEEKGNVVNARIHRTTENMWFTDIKDARAWILEQLKGNE